MFFNNNITKRVIDALKKKLADAQKEYDAECKRIDEAAKVEIKFIKEKQVKQKIESANKLVEGFISKFI